MKTTGGLISKTALSVLTGAALLLSVPAKGSSILSIESVNGAPGSTGTFDVLLTNTGISSQNIAAFNFELTTSDTNIVFTGVSTSTTTATYIFPSSFFWSEHYYVRYRPECRSRRRGCHIPRHEYRVWRDLRIRQCIFFDQFRGIER